MKRGSTTKSTASQPSSRGGAVAGKQGGGTRSSSSSTGTRASQQPAARGSKGTAPLQKRPSNVVHTTVIEPAGKSARPVKEEPLPGQLGSLVPWKQALWRVVYAGPVLFASGAHLGIEQVEPLAEHLRQEGNGPASGWIGDTDGEVSGKRYFEVSPRGDDYRALLIKKELVDQEIRIQQQIHSGPQPASALLQKTVVATPSSLLSSRRSTGGASTPPVEPRTSSSAPQSRTSNAARRSSGPVEHVRRARTVTPAIDEDPSEAIAAWGSGNSPGGMGDATADDDFQGGLVQRSGAPRTTMTAQKSRDGDDNLPGPLPLMDDDMDLPRDGVCMGLEADEAPVAKAGPSTRLTATEMPSETEEVGCQTDAISINSHCRVATTGVNTDGEMGDSALSLEALLARPEYQSAYGEHSGTAKDAKRRETELNAELARCELNSLRENAVWGPAELSLTRALERLEHFHEDWSAAADAAAAHARRWEDMDNAVIGRSALTDDERKVIAEPLQRLAREAMELTEAVREHRERLAEQTSTAGVKPDDDKDANDKAGDSDSSKPTASPVKAPIPATIEDLGEKRGRHIDVVDELMGMISRFKEHSGLPSGPAVGGENQDDDSEPASVDGALDETCRAIMAKCIRPVENALLPLLHRLHSLCPELDPPEEDEGVGSRLRTLYKHTELHREEISRRLFDARDIASKIVDFGAEGNVEQCELLSYQRLDLFRHAQSLLVDHMIPPINPLLIDAVDVPRAAMRREVADARGYLGSIEDGVKRVWVPFIEAEEDALERERLLAKDTFTRESFELSKRLQDEVGAMQEATARQKKLAKQMWEAAVSYRLAHESKTTAFRAIREVSREKLNLANNYAAATRRNIIRNESFRIAHHSTSAILTMIRTLNNATLPSLEEKDTAKLMALQRKLHEMKTSLHEQHTDIHRELGLVAGEIEWKKDQALKKICDKIETKRVEMEIAQETLDPNAKDIAAARDVMIELKTSLTLNVAELQQYVDDSEQKYIEHTGQPLIEAGHKPIEVRKLIEDANGVRNARIESITVERKAIEAASSAEV